jgi:hypothetical protein
MTIFLVHYNKKGVGPYEPHSLLSDEPVFVLRYYWTNIHALAESLLELNYAINQREQCEITSSADVITSVVCATALTNQDVSSSNNFTAELLYSETLALAISSVSGTSYRFFMCH